MRRLMWHATIVAAVVAAALAYQFVLRVMG